MLSLFDKICDWGQRNPEMVGFILIMSGLCIIWFFSRLLKQREMATRHDGRTNEALQMTPTPSAAPTPNSERRITRSQASAVTTPQEGLRQREAKRTPGTMGYASTGSPGFNRWSSYVDEPTSSQQRPHNVPPLNLSGAEYEWLNSSGVIPTDQQLRKKDKRVNLDEWLEKQNKN
ncbi:unnamed protein product [Caenorhabditis brenneri]